jgi:shikimate kinase
MRDLMAKRYPVYAEADLCILSDEQPHEAMVTRVIEALSAHLEPPTDSPSKDNPA